MSSTIILILITAGILAFFAVGMSLTLIFKGHNIKSEISENEHLRARGLKCAVQQERELQGLGDDCSQGGCSSADCAQCIPNSSANKK